MKIVQTVDVGRVWDSGDPIYESCVLLLQPFQSFSISHLMRIPDWRQIFNSRPHQSVVQ